MPYESQAQAGYFHTHKAELEKQGVDVDEWDRATKGKKLPKRKHPLDKSKKNMSSQLDLILFKIQHLTGNVYHDEDGMYTHKDDIKPGHDILHYPQLRKGDYVKIIDKSGKPTYESRNASEILSGIGGGLASGGAAGLGAAITHAAKGTEPGKAALATIGAGTAIGAGLGFLHGKHRELPQDKLKEMSAKLDGLIEFGPTDDFIITKRNPIGIEILRRALAEALRLQREDIARIGQGVPGKETLGGMAAKLDNLIQFDDDEDADPQKRAGLGGATTLGTGVALGGGGVLAHQAIKRSGGYAAGAGRVATYGQGVMERAGGAAKAVADAGGSTASKAWAGAKSAGEDIGKTALNKGKAGIQSLLAKLANLAPK